MRECGYKMEEFGVLGRWLTVRAAARYEKLTDPIVDEFARAFDSLARTGEKYGVLWGICLGKVGIRKPIFNYRVLLCVSNLKL